MNHESTLTMRVADVRAPGFGLEAASSGVRRFRRALARAWHAFEPTPAAALGLDLLATLTVAVGVHLLALSRLTPGLATPGADAATLLGTLAATLVAGHASALAEPRVMAAARDTWVRAALVGLVAAVALATLAPSPVEPLGPALFGGGVAFGLGAWRRAAQRRRDAARPRRIVMVGADAISRRFANLIERLDPRCHEIVGLVTTDDGPIPSGDLDGRLVLGSFHELDEICVARNVGMVVLGEELERTNTSVEVLNRLKRVGVPCRTAASLTMALSRQVSVELVGARRLLEGFESIERGGRRVTKRATDIVLGAIGLLLFAAMCPLLWVVVRLDSPGPLFFSQLRVGQAGREFRVYKVRTMRVAATAERWAGAETHRITRLGALLRKLRIDEFPQFWNVLRGDMSIVGPRPEQPGITRQLEKSIPMFGLRHLVKPGITGWAQIHHGYASSIEDSRAKLAYDLYYVHNYSLWLDIDIMLRTFFVMLLGYGAR